MEDIKTSQDNTEKKKKDFDWGEGIPELRESSIDIILKDTVKIPLDRYEKLLEAETTLKILCRFIDAKSPYELLSYRTIAGEYMPPEKEDGAE